MLVATPGQTASYTLLSSAPTATTTTKICRTSTATPKGSTINSAIAVTSTNTITNKNSTNNNIGGGHNKTRSLICKLPEVSRTTSSATNAATALMKTLSVRLNRGTEFLKGTVQKALISTTTNTSKNATTNAGASIFNINKPTTAGTYSSSFTATAANKITNTGNAALAALATPPSSLSSSLSSTASSTTKIIPSAAFLKLYSVPPTALHRYPENRLYNSSVDSLYKEMYHFKPIRTSTPTPWKCGSKSRGVSLKKPKAILAKKIYLNKKCDDDEIAANNTLEYLDDGNNTRNYLRPKQSATSLTTIITMPKHKSAFVCLIAANPQMNNNINMQIKKVNSRTLGLHRTKSIRGRTKAKQRTVSTIHVPRNSQLTLRTRNRDPSVLLVNKISPDLIAHRSVRNIRSKATVPSGTSGTTVLATKKTKSKLILNSTKTINIVTLVKKNKTKKQRKKRKIVATIADAGGKCGNVNAVVVAAAAAGLTSNSVDIGKSNAATVYRSRAADSDEKRKIRKRKLSTPDLFVEMNSGKMSNAAAIVTDGSMPRKSARLSKDCNEMNNKISGTKCSSSTLSKRQSQLMSKRRSQVCFSPPLTRARLKQMSQAKLNTGLD